MSLSAKIRKQLIGSFRAELAEHVQAMTDGMLAIEQHSVTGEQRQTSLENIFRAAHSLKGAARAVGVTAVEQLAHALEDVLRAMQSDAIELTSELFTACYHALDAIQAVQAAYESGETVPPVQVLQALVDLDRFRRGGESVNHQDGVPLSPVNQSSDQSATDNLQGGDSREQPARSEIGDLKPDETIRVSVSKLDALMDRLSELLVTKIRAEQRMTQLRQAQEFVAVWQEEWLSARAAYSRLTRSSRTAHSHLDGELTKDLACLIEYTNTSQARLHEVDALMNTLSREQAHDTTNMALVIDELEQEIKRMQMLPLGTITGSFGRMVRDLAQASGKEVVLKIVGNEIELDKYALEQIKDPLIHLLRNAIDHGIEPPERRATLGKPRSGTITLTAEQVGKDVIICVSDDGAGLDMKAIRRIAIRRGVANAHLLSETELEELIFNAGFSTSPVITDVSGRGVGLDVVHRNVGALNGRINVEWATGTGSTFTLTLPLRLAGSRGLLVRVSNALFAIPLNAVERIRQISPEEIVPLSGRDTLRHNGQSLMLAHLGDVLDLPRTQDVRDKAHAPAIILAVAEQRMAFVADGLVGEQEIVIKGMGKQLARVGGIAGASVMGNGEIVLVLNAADLIKLALQGKAQPVLATPVEAEAVLPAAKRPRRILIVDDSITTRTLEKNILEAAGYTVQLATDGQEALGMIAAGSAPDLIISDVAMPRLDGFGLTQKIKSEARTAGVPIILVTSLDSPNDKVRGIEVGADAYIVKSSFDQTNLLETIEQLL